MFFIDAYSAAMIIENSNFTNIDINYNDSSINNHGSVINAAYLV